MDSHSWGLHHPLNTSHSSRLSSLTGSALWLLALLWLVSLFRMIDLQIIGVLLEPIRAELGFSDTRLGMISGLSFALVYAVLGLPIAWLADRTNRVRIIAVALALWSLMTMLCGLASGFTGFFLARMGVGIGEAGGYGPTAALLHDRVEPRFRSRAFAILGSAIPAGVFCSFLIGALFLDSIGWRGIFLVIGLPGILLALLLLLTLRDDRQPGTDRVRELPGFSDFSASFKALFAQRQLRLAWAASAFCMLGATGSGIWMPSFYMRVHNLSVLETGVAMALIYGASGVAGTLLGGALADSGKRGQRHFVMMLCAFSALCMLVAAAFVLFSSSLALSLSALALMVLFQHINVGPLLVMVQEGCCTGDRALAQAVNVFCSTLFGLGCGALTVGILSDTLPVQPETLVLPLSIFLVLVAGYGSACLVFFRAARKLPDEER